MSQAGRRGAIALAVPISRRFFELARPGVTTIVVAMGSAGLAIAGLALTDDRFVPACFRPVFRLLTGG